MPETPNGATVQAHTADGDVLDITESVKVAYDIVTESLDWGSGFLSHEEQELIYDLAEKLGFESPNMRCHYKRHDFAADEACGRCFASGRWAHFHMINAGTCQVMTKED